MEANQLAVEAEKEARKEVVVAVVAALVHQTPYPVMVAWTKTEVDLAEHRELQESPTKEAAERYPAAVEMENPVSESPRCLVQLGLT
jgi:hypothetical protein